MSLLPFSVYMDYCCYGSVDFSMSESCVGNLEWVIQKAAAQLFIALVSLKALCVYCQITKTVLEKTLLHKL